MKWQVFELFIWKENPRKKILCRSSSANCLVCDISFSEDALREHAYLSVGPLSLCVDGAVALCVLTGGLWLWRVPLKGAAKLKTLVLRRHCHAEPREALRVQVSLHARGHAVGAFETGSPGRQSHSRLRAIHSHAPPRTSMFLWPDKCTFHFKHCRRSHHNWHGYENPAKSFGIWHISVCKCHVCGLSHECLLCWSLQSDSLLCDRPHVSPHSVLISSVMGGGGEGRRTQVCDSWVCKCKSEP